MARLRIRLRPWPVAALVGWTLFCWVNRVPLLWTSSSQTEAEKLRGTIPIVIFVAMALVAAVGVLRSADVLAGWPRRAALVLAVWSAGYWVLRLPFILANHHPWAFDAIHSVLASVSVGLAVWVLVRLLGPQPSVVESISVSGAT